MFKPNNNKYSRNKKNELKKDSVFKLSASNFLSQVDNPFYVKNHNSDNYQAQQTNENYNKIKEDFTKDKLDNFSWSDVDPFQNVSEKNSTIYKNNLKKSNNRMNSSQKNFRKKIFEKYLGEESENNINRNINDYIQYIQNDSNSIRNNLPNSFIDNQRKQNDNYDQFKKYFDNNNLNNKLSKNNNNILRGNNNKEKNELMGRNLFKKENNKNNLNMNLHNLVKMHNQNIDNGIINSQFKRDNQNNKAYNNRYHQAEYEKNMMQQNGINNANFNKNNNSICINSNMAQNLNENNKFPMNRINNINANNNSRSSEFANFNNNFGIIQNNFINEIYNTKRNFKRRNNMNDYEMRINNNIINNNGNNNVCQRGKNLGNKDNQIDLLTKLMTGRIQNYS